MIQQVEVFEEKAGRSIVWIHGLDYEAQKRLKPGVSLMLRDEAGGFASWTISQLFVSVSDNAQIPPKSRKVTINSFFEIGLEGSQCA